MSPFFEFIDWLDQYLTEKYCADISFTFYFVFGSAEKKTSKGVEGIIEFYLRPTLLTRTVVVPMITSELEDRAVGLASLLPSTDARTGSYLYWKLRWSLHDPAIIRRIEGACPCRIQLNHWMCRSVIHNKHAAKGFFG
jgi:hypothetical protein